MESSIVENNSKSICDFRLIFAIVVIIIFIFIFCNNNNVVENVVENMAPGVVTQMYAQDAQDTYLKGNIDQIATGNYLLNWNHPTRLATGSHYYTTGPNRGALLKNLCYACKKENCDCKNGPVYYPMGYPGDYYEFPTPDINYPLPYIVSNGAFVREGFEKNDVPLTTIPPYGNKSTAATAATVATAATAATLNLFHVDWCGHCTKFKPVFEGELKDLIASSKIPVKLVAIDCDKNKELATKYNIESYPTLILEVNNKFIQYQGERNAQNIIEFLKKHINM